MKLEVFLPQTLNHYDSSSMYEFSDNYQNDKTMKYIKVEIKQKENKIKIKNGGKGIPIQIHKQFKIYVRSLLTIMRIMV